MLDPAKLATNCVSASGSISLRLAEALNAAPACDSDGKYAPERRRLEAVRAWLAAALRLRGWRSR